MLLAAGEAALPGQTSWLGIGSIQPLHRRLEGVETMHLEGKVPGLQAVTLPVSGVRDREGGAVHSCHAAHAHVLNTALPCPVGCAWQAVRQTLCALTPPDGSTAQHAMVQYDRSVLRTSAGVQHGMGNPPGFQGPQMDSRNIL